MTRQPVGVPVDADVIARALGRHPDYRVLRRMERMERRNLDAKGATLVGCAIDCETNGLDHSGCRIIELAVQRFVFDELGRIVQTGRPRTWFEDPGVPLSPTITRLTGLTDRDVAGRSISDGEATCMIASSDIVIAHNAAFDRPFVERRLPEAAGRPWICSMNDLDWRELGFEGRAQTHLLAQMGWFYEAHRAETDVAALLHLLDHRLNEGGTVLRKLFLNASQPTWEIEAVDAPFAAKDILRERGYRWNAARRFWRKEVRNETFDEEVEWAALNVYSGVRSPSFRQVSWVERYRSEG